MESTTSDILTFGSAAAITLLLLRTVFQFVQRYIQPATKNEDHASDSLTEEIYEKVIENHHSIKTMCVQVAEMHETLQVTRAFQRAFTAIVESQKVQNNILKELTAINTKSLRILEYLSETSSEQRSKKS